MGHGEELDAARELFVETAEIKRAFIAGHRDVVELRAGALRDHLPRDEIAVMLELGEQDGVAGLEVVERPCRGDKIDALGGAASEDDLLGGAGVDELRDAFASTFVNAGGAIAQLVNAAMDVGVVVLVVALDGLENLTRFLRGGAVVEVDERVPVDLLIQDREIFAQLLPVDCCSHGRAHVLED